MVYGDRITADEAILRGFDRTALAHKVVIESGSATIPVDIGDVEVTIGTSVEISNDTGNPIPVSGTVTETNSGAIKAAVEAVAALIDSGMLAVKAGVAGGDTDRDVIKAVEECYYESLTASKLLANGPGRFYGLIVTASDSGTIRISDNTSAAAPDIIPELAVAAGYTFVPAVGIKFTNGLYFAKGGTSVAVTVLWIED